MLCAGFEQSRHSLCCSVQWSEEAEVWGELGSFSNISSNVCWCQLSMLCCELQIINLCPQFMFSCRPKPNSTMAYCTTEREVKWWRFLFIIIILGLPCWIQVRGVCMFVFQCLTPVLLKESPRFRWADLSHSFRYAMNHFCHDMVYWNPEKHSEFLSLSFNRNCPVLCQDVMKWWSTLSISWLLSTTATSKTQQPSQVM